MKPNYRFFKDTEGTERIMSVKIPERIPYLSEEKESREELMAILEEYFPGSEVGIMYDERFRGHDVIAFANAEDCSAFALSYGHRYGK